MIILLPRACLLCGGPVLGSGRPGPVCDGCLERCQTIEGAVCRRCGGALVSEEELCTACRDRPPGPGNHAALAYRGTARELISLYKLSGRRHLAPLLADRMRAVLGRRLEGRLVVPIPASPQRRRRLGWDPVRVLLYHMSEPLSLIVAPLLVRKPGTQQKELGYAERLENAASLFSLKEAGRPLGRVRQEPVVLFDDIYTTGATMAVCRQLLENAGLEVSETFTLAVD